MTKYYGALEAGGTKFNCAIVDQNRTIVAQRRIPTTHPQETLSEVIHFFNEQKSSGYEFDALGVASFGPVDLHRGSPTYGQITKTPKPHWSDTPLVDILQQALDCRIEFDTDVNAAALAEYKWGAGVESDVVIYITVGTGLGGGVVINGQPLHGLIHPEIGHMLIPEIEGIKGVCPFHGSCVEGLASGTAMGKIWQQSAETLEDSHRAWDIESQVLAKLCHNLLVTFSPQKIVLGGGVMNKPGLLEKVHKYTEQSLAGYLVMPQGMSVSKLICLPGLGQHSGVMGAFALVQ